MSDLTPKRLEELAQLARDAHDSHTAGDPTLWTMPLGHYGAIARALHAAVAAEYEPQVRVAFAYLQQRDEQRTENERLRKGLQDLLDKHDHEDSKRGHWFSYITPEEIAEVLRPGSGGG